jgi:hypothetical protein
VRSEVGIKAAACFRARVEAAACSRAGDKVVTSSGGGIEDGRGWQRRDGFYGDNRARESTGTKFC